MKWKLLINFLSYYFAWIGIAICAQHELFTAVWGILLCFLFIHFRFVSEDRLREFKSILLCSLLGISLDSILHHLNLFQFKSNYLIWLLPIWIIFTSTINHSLKLFLNNRAYIVFIIGGLAGPLSYFFASKFNLIIYQISISTLFIHFFIWGILMLYFKFKRNLYAQNI